ncbi:RsmE family RNA methyltransferase [Candidatus Dojkabacteria bacterium]|nr:RsmE family RNA methyltransferase [Candidatus Dojkabacteria bacterium]
MNYCYIPHKVKPGDILNLSDSDSDIIIKKGEIQPEDIIEIQALTQIYRAQVTFINKSSVEIKILEQVGSGFPAPESSKPQITIVQSISNDSKFNYFLEKITEIGVSNVIPIESKYSLLKRSAAIKKFGLWRKIIKDAAEQSRNPTLPYLYKPFKISSQRFSDEISTIPGERICLTTEAVETKSLKELIQKNNSYIIAIGPEKGWHSKDHEIFEDLNFRKVSMKGNILRTETAAIVVASIIKFMNGEI